MPDGTSPVTSPLFSSFWTTHLSRTRWGPSGWKPTCTAPREQRSRAWRSGDPASLAGGSPTLFCRREQQLDHKDSTRDNNQERKSASWEQSNPSDKEQQTSTSETSAASSVRCGTPHISCSRFYVLVRELQHQVAHKSEEKRIPLGDSLKQQSLTWGFNLLFQGHSVSDRLEICSDVL